jgi:hypothetical protein
MMSSYFQASIGRCYVRSDREHGLLRRYCITHEAAHEQVEPVFGQADQEGEKAPGFRRFLWRGLIQVRGEFHADLRAKIAFEALREHSTVADLAQAYEVASATAPPGWLPHQAKMVIGDNELDAGEAPSHNAVHQHCLA